MVYDLHLDRRNLTDRYVQELQIRLSNESRHPSPRHTTLLAVYTDVSLHPRALPSVIFPAAGATLTAYTPADLSLTAECLLAQASWSALG